MAFIRPLPDHWKPEDFALPGAVLADPVRHVARTVCLLESRCDDYAEYLRAIVVARGGEWVAAVDQWNAEECRHGELLRRLCVATDPTFPFPEFMDRYTQLVRYHPADGRSVRGSLGAELVSRCVVEALASTLYRVLADGTGDAGVRPVFSALAQDEARHFGMFSRMLAAEAAAAGGLGVAARCVHAVRRVAALEDGQIMIASRVVAGRGHGPVSVRGEAHWYLARLYALYRWKHLRYAARMLLQTVAVRPTRARVAVFATALWVGVKVRWSGPGFVPARLATSGPRLT